MARIRNVSPEERFVPAANIVVAVDESFEISEELFAALEWEIPGVFEVVVSTPTKKEVKE